MAIIRTEGLERVCLVKCNPVVFRILSNLPVSEHPLNYLRLVITDNPEVDQTIEWSYNGVSVSFTFKNAADNSGVELSRQGSLSLSQYTDKLASEIEKNYEVYNNFNIYPESFGSTHYVNIFPRYSNDFEFTTESNANGMAFEPILTSSSDYRLNPSIALLVEIYNQESEEYDRPLAHILPILVSNEFVEFDIQSDFNLSYHLPDPVTIGVGGDYLNGCTKNWTRFKLKYSERFGAVPQVQSLISHDFEFWAIHGGQSFLTQFRDWWAYYESNEKFLTLQPFPKVVTFDQPEYLYWLVRRTDVISLRVVATTRDQTETEYLLSNFEAEFGQVIYLKTGFTQLGLTIDPANPVVSYTVQLLDSKLDPISELIRYNLTAECLAWERYFLFGNSIAGCDTVRGTGKVQVRVSHQSQSGSRIVSKSSIREGQGRDFLFNRRGRVRVDGRIGYKSRAYILYLRELLLADECWEIDVNSQQFIPLIIDDRTVRLIKDDQDLYSLEWSYQYAFEECALGSASGGSTDIVIPDGPGPTDDQNDAG